MFGFFKKKKIEKKKYWEVTDTDLENLKKILLALPKSYHFIVDTIDKNVLLSKYRNTRLGDHWFSFSFEEKGFESLEKTDVDFPSRIVSNIVLESEDGDKLHAELYFLTKGILTSYNLNSEKTLETLKIKDIDVQKVRAKIFTNEEHDLFKRNLKETLNKDLFNFLDTEDSFVLDAFQTKLRTIKYFNNGDYLCVDDDWNLYKAYHDPFELVETSINLKQLNSVSEIENLLKE
ncbi:hypothetical protein POV27_00840 [Aureisphaera galaxeae]|uniref:hypothetical protein n=1 Tax=Aureisphaera galaxeae TaxID=1538023 RepID=UPI002350D15F|nr:hypothetical protein [Aureisphaera galaxeae]MDC8002583.1 hypothetical protein [Aureisphaera galaxeae]